MPAKLMEFSLGYSLKLFCFDMPGIYLFLTPLLLWGGKNVACNPASVSTQLFADVECGWDRNIVLKAGYW